MPLTTVRYAIQSNQRRSGVLASRRGRVWKAPRPVDVRTTDKLPRGSWMALILAAGLIATGAAAMDHLDNGPAADVAPVAVADVPLGSMYSVVDQVGARELWEQGITGAGVNVAMIDTGVASVSALRAPGKVVAAVDLSTEQNDPNAAYVDNFGHGTHLAGIIAGRDPGADPAQAAAHPEWFLGVAPDAGIVSVKVAGRDGVVSPASLVTGIDWVVEHADELEIRVLNLALSTDDASPVVETAVAAAVERAWDAGIVVVTSAGNDGAEANGLVSPATDPFVIAVGGVEATADGLAVADFTSRGDGVRNPDVAAPGAHIESLRAPGSAADVDHPEGFVNDQRFLASGSSQSAAVAAGVAALLLDADPTLTPDQVKAALVASATEVAGADARSVGAGVVSAVDAVAVDPGPAVQSWDRTDSPVAIPRSAGSVLVHFDPTGSTWMGSTWMGSTWMGSTWMG